MKIKDMHLVIASPMDPLHVENIIMKPFTGIVSEIRF